MKVTTDLLEKYYAGQCTAAEEEVVTQWLEQTKDLSGQEQDMLKEVRLSLEEDVLQESETLQRRRWQIKVLMRAAAVFLLLGVSFVLWKNDLFFNKELVDAKPQLVQETTNGQRAHFVLRDGTTITLNSGSTLHYASDFGDKDRKVYLKGEALFEVAKNPEKPFIVVTGRMKTQVLGTVFNVKSYDSLQYKLTVLEGRVQVSDPQGIQHILTANEQIGWMNGVFATKLAVNAPHYALWKDEVMAFDGTTLAEVAKTIERWYGVRVRIENPDLLDQQVTARFEHPQLSELLSTLAFSLKFEYKIKQNEIKIYR